MISYFFMYRYVVTCCPNIPCITHSVKADQYDQDHTNASNNPKNFWCPKLFLICFYKIDQDQADQIHNKDRKRQIHQNTQPVITDQFHSSPYRSLWKQKCDQNTECKKYIDHGQNCFDPFLFKINMTSL